MTRHRGGGGAPSKPQKKLPPGDPPVPSLPRGDTFGPGKPARSGLPVEPSFGPGKGKVPDLPGMGTRTANGTLVAPLDGGRRRRRTKKRKMRGRKTRRGY